MNTKTTQMNSIFLDIGNSSYKLAARDADSNWGILMRGGNDEFDKMREFVVRRELLSKIIYSSVRRDAAEKLESHFKDLQLIRIHSGLIPSQFLNYNTTGTLGVDRFLTCFGAVQISGTSVVVIDAGTACTVDYMTAKGVFEGGVIMPGISVLKNSMKKMLPELPSPDKLYHPEFPGKSTVDCINIGLYGGFNSALREFIHRFQLIDEDVRVFVTGGDSSLVVRLVDPGLSIEVREFLIFEGLEAFVHKFCN
jgi:type III pantothenate kinase